MREGEGAWQQLSTACAGTTTHPGEPGHLYTLRLTASDNVGNEASTEAQAGAPRITKYYYHSGRRVAMRAADVVYYLHADHLGSTSLTTDANGNEVARQLYYPYGDTRYAIGEPPTDFGFTGQRTVPGTGLVFMHARYYHPSLGRFVSADTIVPNPGNPQDLNRYAYVRNNPLNYIDPSGHAACLDEECNWVEHPVSGEIMWRGLGSPPPPAPYTAPAEGMISALPDLYDLAEGTRGTASGITMLRGGFYMVQGSTYAGQTIVRGTAEAKAAAGLVPQFTHAAASHPALAGYTGPLGAAGRAVSSHATAAALGVNYGVDIYQYGWGSKRDVGLNSSEFAAAMTTDTVIQLGPPALGAGVGFALAGPPGAVMGGGIGSIFSAGWSFLGRDATVSFTDEHIWGPIWAWESQHSAVYPEFHYYYPYHGPTIP